MILIKNKFPFKRTASLVLLVLMFTGCSQESTEKQDAPKPLTGCQQCHQYTLDAAHDLACIACHGGDEHGQTVADAHSELISEPAHPDRMAKGCGQCHQDLVDGAQQALHFTLANEVNAVRAVFGAAESLATLTEIPVHGSIETVLDLADDLLRRRCLRCHVYSNGDTYPETMRGTGCAACHLQYRGGELKSHTFMRLPTDDQCLHCHYGNFVGADFYGRFEHDFSLEFRTPFPTGPSHPRPYGVEYHQLAPDIHQTKGMNCIDCHSGPHLMGKGHGSTTGEHVTPISCESCHQWQGGSTLPLTNLAVENGNLVLTPRLGGKRLTVPTLRHPAHQTYGKKTACVVCHAQWNFNDEGTHLMRHDEEDYDPWMLLTVQGSFEVENQLETNLFGEGEGYEVPFMRDKITGTPYLGIWFKGYKLRRWEYPLIGRDVDGILKMYRPILDLHLSYVNAEEEVIFDSVGAMDKNHGLRPYTPHTIGRAGAFFQQRLTDNLATYGKQ